MSKVLIVDDEKHIREDLRKHLKKRKYEVYTAPSVERARNAILTKKPDYAIIDLKMDPLSEVGGIKLINYAKRNQPKMKTVILSGRPFSEAKRLLKKELKGEFNPDEIIKEIENDYIHKGDEAKKNYIINVLDKLDELESRSKNCFVILPFSGTASCTESQWSNIYENLIKPAVEESGFKYKCRKAESHWGSLIGHVLDNLNRSELVIADITDNNLNVLYELGIRHALQRTPGFATIIITQNMEEIPTDLKGETFKFYGWRTEEECNAFREEIKKVIYALEMEPCQTISRVAKYLDPLPVNLK
jgi:CheY-like chemotaxis protein